MRGRERLDINTGARDIGGLLGEGFLKRAGIDPTPTGEFLGDRHLFIHDVRNTTPEMVVVLERAGDRCFWYVSEKPNDESQPRDSFGPELASCGTLILADPSREVSPLHVGEVIERRLNGGGSLR